MLKNRGRTAGAPSRPEPDYEVVEFPSDQYMNAKLQPPPPPPPRPPTSHPLEAGASCGLCGGGGARVRCTECGRRALCASCDDMYHRHPKRRHHQRQALSQAQVRDERPPLPPKAAAPVPPPRRHKAGSDRASASPRPVTVDPRRPVPSALPAGTLPPVPIQSFTMPHTSHFATQRAQVTSHSQHTGGQSVGSMPYLPNVHHPRSPVPTQVRSGAPGQFNPAWGRPRGSLQGFNVASNMMQAAQLEAWEAGEQPAAQSHGWGRPLRRGASVMELGAPCGCAHCAMPWRYGSCANLDHPWLAPPAWPACCAPHPTHLHHATPHPPHAPQTPQPYRRAESRAVSRATSRAGSRAPSPAMSVRSRASRRAKPRSPSPPLPSSDADSESEDDAYPSSVHSKHKGYVTPARDRRSSRENKNLILPERNQEQDEDSLGPAPPPPDATWQCEHCTFVNEPGVRVCAVCCRTPTVTPKIIEKTSDSTSIINGMERIKIAEKQTPGPASKSIEKQPKQDMKSRSNKEKVSTGCGPSPPREEKSDKGQPKPTKGDIFEPRACHDNAASAATPTKSDIFEPRVRHDIAVGPSPPKEVKYKNHSAIESQEASSSVRASPYRTVVSHEAHTKHSISVGPSPPREIAPKQYNPIQIMVNNRQQSPGTSPPRQRVIDRAPSSSSSRNVSNTGTSPPPQSISTQTYEVPSNWERAPSAQRSRPRRRFRDDAHRERSHSRHSLSSDTRESERSVRSGRTSGGGRWEWHEAGSPAERPEWPGERLARRASHLDLRRPRAERPDRSARRTSLYGSEAPSPEPLSGGRAMSLEALAGAGSKREAERGLELARLMSEAERLGFSAAEVHAALAQNPMAPLSWLRERWPSLCAGVRAAAARLAPGAAVSELEARAALARHRGAMWPAVTDCVERARRQEDVRISEDGRMRGHVWGSPNGVDDDAAPPVLSGGRSHRTRAEESSDEFEVTTNNKFQDDDWMYLPLDIDYKNINKKKQNRLDSKYANTISNKSANSFSTASSTEDSANDMNAPNEEINPARNTKTTTIPNDNTMNQSDIAEKLKSLLIQAGIPSINEKLLLKGLLSDTMIKKTENISINNKTENKRNSLDFTHFENDFINAYNELSRSSPLPNVSRQQGRSEVQNHKKSDVKEIKSKTKNENIASFDNKTNAKIKTSRYKSVHKSTRTDSEDEYQVNKKIVTDGAISSTSQSNRHILQSPDPDISQIHTMKNVESNISSSREEDKSKNLSDMVDKTSKLIQKMKDEIHSDINSLHDQSKSHSDGEISSNDSNFASDEYSNYSNSHNESEDLSSAEKESTSSEEETNKHSEKTENTPATRTSSEENEQFEEAMDHIDDQIEDFKQTNIEILESIAKSLQEEHTFTVEINESKQTGQDVNNNLFDAVNSFDEIYEQLNSNTVEIIAPTPNESTQDSKLFSFPEKPPKIVIKQNLNLTHYNPEFQTRVEITENKPQPMNASITNIELQSIRMTHYNPEFPTKVFISQTKPQVLVATINELSDSFNENSDTSEESDGEKDPQIVADNQVETPEEMKNSSVHQSESNYNPVPHVTIQVTPGIPHSQIQSDPKTQQPPFEDTNEVLDENKSGIVNVQVESDKSISSNATTTISNEENIAKPKLVNTNKSNIPKLVRLTQNNKTKPDKNTSKVISSKVPVRRGSIKQYPAPAPPKTHFGNVQSGHVKHLQNQLFNGKQVKNASITNAAPAVKPTTSSTLSKKKPAPKPPLTIEKQPSPTKTSPTEKKDNFFRETCRTEDEWSDSGSDDSDQQTITATKEFEPPPTPSAPQPITLRRISGQFIDLARVQLPEGSPERQARMLLAEGATESWEQAQLAVELISRGTEPPAALLAALECADLSTALAYLQQDCELCAAKFPEFEMVSMLRCTHRCCRECARHYFTVQISERSIADCVCPYCKEPELENLPEDSWLEYFAHLDIQLKTLVDPDLHELFQRKLRDRTLARDPNFRWCVECSSGFFVHPKQKKLRCPECKSISCATCRRPWSPNHEGLTCEQYTTWLDDNDPEKSVAAVQQHLRENGLDCPRCHFKYSLSRGGCMHFTCTQCKYEFCYGCGKPFMMGARCGLSEYCARLGLHAHHPRNCLFYLRDKEPHELQTLLQMNNVLYETEAPAGGSARCPLQLQRETPAGLVDAACGSEVLPNQAGLCKNHYLEYLSRLVRTHGIDPLPILGTDDLETLVRRAALRLPPKPYGSLDGIYKRGLTEIVREKIPLD